MVSTSTASLIPARFRGLDGSEMELELKVPSSHSSLLPFPSCFSSRPGLRVKETKEVYEGELTELTPTEAENPLSGYGKTISHVVVGLKTVKGTKQLRLDPTIYEAIQKERVVVGDVIYIEANTGAVKVRLARRRAWERAR